MRASPSAGADANAVDVGELWLRANQISPRSSGSHLPFSSTLAILELWLPLLPFTAVTYQPQLQDRERAGGLAAGTRLPPVRQLAADLGLAGSLNRPAVWI
jgi:hypothetical protein